MGVVTIREGERLLHLLLIIVLILIATPKFHFDTSELNADACLNTAREDETIKETENNPQQQQVLFQK